MAQGLAVCGIVTHVSNEIRKPFCELMALQGKRHVVQEDLGDNSIVAAIHALHGSPAWPTSGFSCQPWSLLGDRRRTEDARASSLAHTLRAEFLLQAHTILLECVEGAGQDKEVRKLLGGFCALTGFHRAQIDLSLSDLAPSVCW